MTTPIPSGGNNSLGGAGLLGGTNPLQQSLDSLTRAVQSLSGQMQNFGAGSLGGPNNNATRQQGQAATQPFPKMQNPFQPNSQQGGIGGGGPGGRGNVSQPNTFGSFASMATAGTGVGMMLNGLASFGSNMMQNQFPLNQYATQSMLGANINGMSQSQAMKVMYGQAGAMPGRLNSTAFGLSDMLGAMPYMQQLGGSQIVNQTQLGRAGLSAMAGFGISNPTLGATTSAQLSAAMLSPSFSYQMMRMGMGTLRNANGTALNGAQSAQKILQGFLPGFNKMTPAQVYGNLSSPKGQVDIQNLFGAVGIPNQAAQQYLQTYAQLFNKGYSTSAAQNLINKATTGTTASMSAARSQLAKAGVSTATNDLSQVKQAQSVVTGRQGEYASGFNDAISQSTGLLNDFNNMLNKILNGPAGTAAGYGGGMSGMLSSVGKGGGMGIGLGGTLMLSRLFGLGGGGAGGAAGSMAANAVGGAASGGVAGGTIGSIAAAAVPVVAGALIGAAAKAIGDKLSPSGTKTGVASQVLQKQGQLGKSPSLPLGMGPFSGIISWLGSEMHVAGMGGAGSTLPASGQQTNKGNTQTGGISSAAKKAVGKAESQLGVPYQYGDEIPGVGFDCSGLIQWAYGQAGIHLPRTSQAMWDSLRSKRIPLSQVQEGDIVFAAGSDGSASSPGHVGLMVSRNELIQAPQRGQNVQNIAFNAGGWTGAARPTGSVKGFSNGSGAMGPVSTSGSSVSGTGTAGGGSLFAGNMGGGPGTNSYGSANEVDIIAGMGGGYGGGAYAQGGNGGGILGNSNGSSGTANKNSGVTGGNPKVPGGLTGSVASVLKKVASKYGWGSGIQWADLVKLENMEAGFNLHAKNSTSGAYGIAQFINGPSEYYQYGGNPNTAEGQAIAMMNYIKQRYPRGPSQAWAHEISNNPHWYGAGGVLQPGVSVVGERGPELALNSGGKTQIISNNQTSALINALKGNVAQSPWQSTQQGGGSMSSSSSSSQAINVNFGPNSIVINSAMGGNGTSSIASNAGREVARQIVKHINQQAVHQAIRGGNKL